MIKHEQIKLAQIAYNKATREMVKTEIVFDGSNANAFLENWTIARQISSLNPDLFRGEYIGILSARFEEKLKWKQSVNSIKGIIDGIEDDGFSADVYSFFRSYTPRNVWVKAEQWQPGVLPAAVAIFKEFERKTGIVVGDITKLETPVIYQNAFVAKKSIYFQYVNEWLLPLIDIMQKNEEVSQLLSKDAKYTGSKLNREECIKVFGVPYYTLHPFVCERFFSTFLAINPEFTIKHI